MLVNMNYHDLFENIKSYITYVEPSHVTTTEDCLVELLDAILMYLQYLPKLCSELIFTSLTQYELLQNVFGNLRDFHRLKVNGCVEYETIEYVIPHFQLMAQRVVNICFTLFYCQLDEFDQSDVSRVNSKLANQLVQVIPVELEVMHICCTNLKGSKSEEVERFIKQLIEASPDILRESLTHLQEHMVNTVTPSASTCNIHVMIEFILIILTDVPKDLIRHDKLFVLLERVRELTNEVFILDRNLEDNMNATSGTGLNLLENIELLKEHLKNVFLKARSDSSQLRFPMSNGPLFMTLLLSNLNDLVNSNASSVALIKEEIKQVKEDLEIIRLFFGYVEQEFHRDLWTQKIKLVKKEVQEKIPKSSDFIVANAPNNLVEINSSNTVGKTIVGFEEETEWIIRKLTSGPAEIDVISIVGMPGLGKTTLAFRVYNDKSIVDHFDVCAWCTVDQERNEKTLLQKIFNQVIGLKERFSENNIDDDVADKLRKKLCGQRKEKKEALWLEVLNNLSSFIFKDEEEVVKVIQLSYDHLSDHVKPCLVYLASYPKDEDIRVSVLKDLWIDLGLVEQIEMKSVEEVVDELISSSLFCALFDLYINETTVLDEDSRLENLTALYELYLLGSEDTEDIFKRFPNLQILSVSIIRECSGEKIFFPRLDVLNELEELRLASCWDSFDEYTHGFPLSLKKMRLQGLALTSDTLSRIARLPNLEELILEDTIIEEGKEWNMEDVTFQNLKSLKLASMQFSEWQVDAEKCFPVLEKLDISRCYELMDIPDSFGDIASLKFINVSYNPQLKESIFNIKEYVEEMTGENKLEVYFYG
ncbi:hypothetical protein H5410_047341 [Solanum commersonii]|uniref:NB-ARC domain-containing protein n=1 Tax=Solanum commersonii TaxID=4109 RepID=A0A9J5XEV0_SOLCO|nr:hypothetical protein H5410_047341 [Solanum commersonii]